MKKASRKQPIDYSQLATKKDLDNFATKSDLAQLKQEMTDHFASKSDLVLFKQEIFDHFDATVENIVSEFKGANNDRISLLEDSKKDHEERITTVEQKVGLRA